MVPPTPVPTQPILEEPDTRLSKALVTISVVLKGEENYAKWKYLMEGLFTSKGLWVESKEYTGPKPSPTATFAIQSNIHEDLIDLIIDTKDAKEMWKIFHNKWSGCSVPDRITAVRKFVGIEFQDPSTPVQLDTDFAQLKSAARTLKAAFLPATAITLDDFIGFMTLSKLPSQFDNVRTLIESTPTTASLSDIEKRVKLEAATQATRSESGLALRAKSNKCTHGWHNPDTCFKCHPNLRPVCEPCKGKGVKS